MQVARGDEAIAAVIAGSAKDSHADTRLAHGKRGAGDRTPGVLHERGARDVSGCGHAIGAAHLLRREQLQLGGATA